MASKNIDEITEAGVRRSERKTKLTSKALQKAIQDIQTKIVKPRTRLLIIMQSVQENNDGSDIKTIASDLTAAAEEFGSLLQSLLSLYEQDLHNEFIEGAQLKEENETLQRALLLIDSLKNRIARQSNELLETRSVYSRHSFAPLINLSCQQQRCQIASTSQRESRKSRSSVHAPYSRKRT